MSRTTFRSASGLPNRAQKSTARDMVRLAQALMEDYPQYYHYFSTPAFTYKGRTYRNHNRLLKGYRSEEHTSELQSIMPRPYAVFCLKKKNTANIIILNKKH